MENLIMILFCGLLVAVAIGRVVNLKAKEKKEAELLERNPEAWKTLKAHEMEKKNKNWQSAGDAAINILKVFLKK